MVIKPLGLPVGSVRALLLLGLSARAVLDLRSDGEVAPWLLTALAIAASAYFASRSAMNASRGALQASAAGDAAGTRRHPLGLPAGSVRFLFLAALAYGGWLWWQGHEDAAARMPVVWVAGAFVLGILVRWLMVRLRPEDVGARFFDHLLALIALISVVGLVALAVTRRDASVSDWVQPLLAAVVVHYFGSR
ncbi:MAG: hypothetical protein AB7T63_14135 [Planctomycetota bacterium]